jgi:hypothetical protein
MNDLNRINGRHNEIPCACGRGTTMDGNEFLFLNPDRRLELHARGACNQAWGGPEGRHVLRSPADRAELEAIQTRWHSSPDGQMTQADGVRWKELVAIQPWVLDSTLPKTEMQATADPLLRESTGFAGLSRGEKQP